MEKGYRAYLDNAATEEVEEYAYERALEYMREHWYNASTYYGVKEREEIEEVREYLVRCVVGDELAGEYGAIFTSGGSESNEIAGKLAFKAAKDLMSGESGIFFSEWKAFPRMDVVEHDSVLRGFGGEDEPEFIGLLTDAYGRVEIEKEEVRNEVRDSLVSVMHVNNETGAVNDIERIGGLNGIGIFHSDGVQGFGKVPLRFKEGIDLYSIAGHKIGAVKGIGALIYSKSLFECCRNELISQEGGYRGGTENLLGIVNLGEVLRGMTERNDPRTFYAMTEGARQTRQVLKDMLIGRLNAHEIEYELLSPEGGSPYIVTISLVGESGTLIQRMLYEKYNVIVGTGSACHAGRDSRVLEALGYGKKVRSGALRFSFSRRTTAQEVVYAIDCLKAVLNELHAHRK